MSVTIPGLIIPEPVGEPEVLAAKFGRSLRVQRYRHPDGRVDEYSHWHASVHPSIVFPVTKDRQVVAQWEFRYGVGYAVLEVSGGNPKAGQDVWKVAHDELRQETGYVAGELVLIHEDVLADPASLTFGQSFFLATNCVQEGDPVPDPGEYIQPILIPLQEWLGMIWTKRIKDQKTIAITMLAMPHLGFRLVG